MTFGVDPDTHIDSLEQAEHATVEGTSKWSCKLTITGTHAKTSVFFIFCISFLFSFCLTHSLFVDIHHYQIPYLQINCLNINKFAHNANFRTVSIILS